MPAEPLESVEDQGTAPQPAPETPSPPPAGPPISAGFSVREALKSRGYNADAFESEDAAFDALLDGAQTYHQHADDLRRYREHRNQFEEYMSELAKPAPPVDEPGKQPPPADEFAWELPKAPPANIISALERDPNTGLFTAPANAPYLAAAAREANEYVQKQQEMGDRIFREFPDLAFRAVQQKAGVKFDDLKGAMERLQRIEQELQERAERERASEAEKYAKEKQKDYFVCDQAGNPVRDPQSGQYVLTPAGAAFRQYAGEAQQMGIQDAQAVRRYAERLVAAGLASGEIPKTQPAAQPRGKQPPPDNGRRFSDRFRTPNRDGTFPAKGDPAGEEASQNWKSSIAADFDEASREMGIHPNQT